MANLNHTKLAISTTSKSAFHNHYYSAYAPLLTSSDPSISLFQNIIDGNVVLGTCTDSSILTLVNSIRASSRFLFSTNSKQESGDLSFIKRYSVVKNNIIKKFHIPPVNETTSHTYSRELGSFLHNINFLSDTLIRHLMLIVPHKVLQTQIILYPSTTICRELHLDRHDKSRKYQNFHSIKLFLNLSDSYRIWGIGPNRNECLKYLDQFSSSRNLDQLEPQYYESSSLPPWLSAFDGDPRLSHFVSKLNSALNTLILTQYDLDNKYDTVFFGPCEFILIDSKQISHKPIYGELGLSIDIVFDYPDIPYPVR